MKQLIIILSFLFCVNINAQDVDITCWHEKIDTNYCPTCPDLKSYEVFTGIKVEFPDTTYRLYMPYKIYDEDTFYIIQDIWNTQIYIGENRVTYASKFEIAERIQFCLGDSSIVPEGSCPCCDEYNYFDSDTAAYYQGRIGKEEFYVTAASHMEGYGKGVIKQVKENYGWELLPDTTAIGFNGLVVMSKGTGRVGFDGAFLAPCRIDPPDVDLLYFDSIADAITGGLSAGDFFLCTKGNLMGRPEHTLQQVY